MDSVTQITLGSAVAVAVMGRRVPVWQSALWGAVAGTTPDLDVVVDFGDAIVNMTRHRAESHALIYLSVVAGLFAGLARLAHRQKATYGRWLLAFWLVFMTHVGIDYLTVYGTQFGIPLTNYPFGRGSIYIIDPLYTLPLLTGLIACLASRSQLRWTWNGIGLILSTAYLAWGLIAQQHVTTIATASLPKDEPVQALLVTPAPFNSILWRVLAMTPEHYYEGWYSLLDESPKVQWARFDRGADLIEKHRDHPGAQKLANFSHGFYRMHQKGPDVYITDLRMGFEPAYVFDFNLGPVDQQGELDPQRVSVRDGMRPDIDASLAWLIQRIKGNPERQPGG